VAGQSFTVQASHPCTNATAYRLVLDGVSGPDLPLSACASGTITATSAGVTAGTHTVALAAVDATSEKRGPSVTIQATAPQTVSPGTPSVTQP
jgi:sugar (pentulose or hexulose) kinase